jgi:alkanesulfonate monooxygenase SsuD/methylene tetrahydromethanopterin reductase-like flavin-dependent oxidoreductase (luciferase family)
MTPFRAGVIISLATPREFVDLAVAAEDAGWDTILTWEAVWGQDAWVTLAAAAMRTSRIRLGTMLTPLPRIRPWDLAGRVATLDNLSDGRAQLAVGLGALHPGWTAFERDEGRKVRAEKLDEGLAIYDGLMRGQPFAYAGTHYSVEPTDFVPPPPPVQRPRVPVWVVGAYPAVRSIERAAQWDGIIPTLAKNVDDHPYSHDDLARTVAMVKEIRESKGLPWAGYEVVVEGVTEPGDAGDATVAAWAEAGGTFWVESDWSMGDDAVAKHRRRIDAGPPSP